MPDIPIIDVEPIVYDFKPYQLILTIKNQYQHQLLLTLLNHASNSKDCDPMKQQQIRGLLGRLYEAILMNQGDRRINHGH